MGNPAGSVGGRDPSVKCAAAQFGQTCPRPLCQPDRHGLPRRAMQSPRPRFSAHARSAILVAMDPVTKRRVRPASDSISPAAIAASNAVQEAFRHRFVEAQYAWTAMFLDHLVRCRRRLGDLDAVLVLGVLGLSALSAARRDLQQASRGGEGNRPRKTVPPGSAINAHSLSDITGIPRETVRRKLASLAKAGLIQRMPDRAWSLATTEAGGARAGSDLQDLTDGAVDGLGQLFARLATLADAAAAGREDAPPPAPTGTACAGPPGLGGRTPTTRNKTARSVGPPRDGLSRARS